MLGFHSIFLLALSRATGFSPETVRRGIINACAPFAQYDGDAADNDFTLTATSGGGGTPANEFSVTSGTQLDLFCPDAMEGYPLKDFSIVFGGDALNAADNIAGTVRVSGLRNGVTVDSVISGGRCDVRVTGESTPCWHSGMTISIDILGSGVVYKLALVGDVWVSGNEAFSDELDATIAAGEAAVPSLAAQMDRFDKQAGFRGLHEGAAPVASMAAARKFGNRVGQRRQGRLAEKLTGAMQGVGQALFGTRVPVGR